MISVCIATHNGAKYIKEELLSILPQLGQNDEVIVSDDGSSDNTIAEIMSVNDDRIRIVKKMHSQSRKSVHYYITHNFGNAIAQAKGDIIFLADQDDVWYPNKVQECLQALTNHTAVLHNLECVDGELNFLGYMWYNEENKFRRHNWFMHRGKHMGCALVFKRELLEYVLPFPEQLVIHDFWLGLIAEVKGGLYYLDKPLIKYRIHGENASGASQKKNSFIYRVYYRLYTIFHALLRITH